MAYNLQYSKDYRAKDKVIKKSTHCHQIETTVEAPPEDIGKEDKDGKG